MSQKSSETQYRSASHQKDEPHDKPASHKLHALRV